MCLSCYTACIRAFINSDGKTVGSTIAPPPEAPSIQGAKAVTCKKGILCASPGCFNERIPQLNDLCSECYQAAKAPSPAVTATSHGNAKISGSTSATAMATGTAGMTTSSTQFMPALLQAMGQRIYCSNGKCMQPVGSSTGGLCPSCFGAQLPASSSETNVPQRQKSPGLPATMSPTLTTPSAPYMSHGSHISQILSMYHVPTTQPSSSAPGTHLSECMASSQPSIVSSVQRMPSVISSIQQITKCATPNCTFSGSPGMNFLCSQCYRKNVEEWKRIGGATVAAAGTGRAQPERSTGRKCIMEGCSNRPAPNQSQLCMLCFQAAVRQETRWVAQQKQAQQGRSQVKSTESRVLGPPHQISSFVSATVPCKTMGCLRFGTSKKNGLCEVCFNRNQPQPQTGAPEWSHTQITVLPHSPPASAVLQQHQLVNTTPHISSNQAPVQVASSSEMIAVTTAGTVSGQRCCRPLCTMFGTSEMGGLCSRCFAEKTMVSSYPNSVPDAPPSSLLSSTSEVSSGSMQSSGRQRECLNAGCKNSADPLLRNHCTECFRKLYPELAQRDEYRICYEGANTQ